MAMTTAGVFSSVGMAIGGTGAMLATGTTALLQGAVQGARAAAPSSSTATPAIMPPTPTPTTTGMQKKRRPTSADARSTLSSTRRPGIR